MDKCQVKLRIVSKVLSMATSTYLSPEEIKAWRPDAGIPPPHQRHEVIKQRLSGNGLWLPRQTAGKRWAIGCVALEITQDPALATGLARELERQAGSSPWSRTMAPLRELCAASGVVVPVPASAAAGAH